MANSVAVAVAVAGAFPRTVAVDSLSSSTIDSNCSKLVHLSSLRFPTAQRIFKLRSRSLKFKPRLPTLMLVQAKKLTDSSFDELLENSDKPILVDFYATWCGPCQFMVPILDKVSSSMIDEIEVVKIDTEEYTSIADKYKITALPTFILFKDGKPCDRFEGAMAADQFIQRIEASLQVKQ